MLCAAFLDSLLWTQSGIDLFCLPELKVIFVYGWTEPLCLVECGWTPVKDIPIKNTHLTGIYFLPAFDLALPSVVKLLEIDLWLTGTWWAGIHGRSWSYFSCWCQECLCLGTLVAFYQALLVSPASSVSVCSHDSYVFSNHVFAPTKSCMPEKGALKGWC